MVSLFVAFFLVATLLVGGLHFVVLQSFLRLMVPASASSLKAVTAVISVALPIAFIGTSALIHYHDTFPVRASYFAAAVWLGAFWNFTMFVALAWLALWVVRITGGNPPTAPFAYAALTAAIFLSAYGVYTAFNPTIVRYTVPIANLPAVWEGKTVVQLSDVHLGAIYREGFFRGIVNAVDSLNPAVVLITGDLFDGTDGDFHAFVSPLKDLKSEYGTYFISGNHETYVGLGQALAAVKGAGVRVLDDAVETLDGLRIIGLGYPERGKQVDPAMLARLCRESAAAPTVLLYHSPSAPPYPDGCGIAMQLSGHTHGGQQFPFGIFPKLIYGGDYPISQFDGATKIISRGVGTWGPPLRIGTKSEIIEITLVRK